MKNNIWHKITHTLAYLSILPLSVSSFVSPVEAKTDKVITQYNQNNTIVCGSRKGERYRCQFDTENDVEIVEVLSSGSCKDKWLYDRRRKYIEVWDGCRARFREIRYSDNNNSINADTIVCGSEKGKPNRCNFNAGNGVEIIKVLSNASCKGNWNYNERRRYIEVRNGCRAEFRARSSSGNNIDDSDSSNNSRTVICESSKGRTQRCQFDTRNGVTLTRQLSNTSCRGNWFSGDGFIEVKNGCRAEFSQGRDNNSFNQQEYDRGYRDARRGRSYNNKNNTEEYDRGYNNGRKK